MAVPLIDLNQQHEDLRPELRDAFERVLDSGQFILGPYVERFERQLAERCQARHTIACSSGTDGLLMAMMAMRIGPGDEVITTPLTFFSTAGSIARLGATPVFVDINPRTYNLEVEDIEGAITEKTKAIMPVHLFGLPANMGPLMDLARSYNLWVIEDAAQSLGAAYEDTPVGAIGDVGVLSFYPTKSLPAMGDAGACVTNDDELAETMRMLRVHGADEDYHFPLVGGNFRIDALHAALLEVKLARLEQWIDRRRELANRYGRKLERVPATTPFEPEVRHHVYNNYTIRVRGGQRDALRLHLDACDIGNRVYYPIPLHRQPCFQYLGYSAGSLPAVETACEQVLSLPIYPEMTDAQQDEVIAAVREFFKAE